VKGQRIKARAARTSTTVLWIRNCSATASQWRYMRAAGGRCGRHLESHIKNPTRSIDAYLPEEKSCWISSRFDLKGQSLRLFWSASPQQEQDNKISSDMGSVPDPKILRGGAQGHLTDNTNKRTP